MAQSTTNTGSQIASHPESPLVSYADFYEKGNAKPTFTGHDGHVAKSNLTDQIVKLVVEVQKITRSSILAELETSIIAPMKIQLADARSRIATLELESRLRAEVNKKKEEQTSQLQDKNSDLPKTAPSKKEEPVAVTSSAPSSPTSNVSNLFPDNFTAEGLKRDVDLENLAKLCIELMEDVIETQTLWRSSVIYGDVEDPAHRERLEDKAEIIVSEMKRRELVVKIVRSQDDWYKNSLGRVVYGTCFIVYNPNMKHE